VKNDFASAKLFVKCCKCSFSLIACNCLTIDNIRFDGREEEARDSLARSLQSSSSLAENKALDPPRRGDDAKAIPGQMANG
jgi:hypothetical protein